MRRSFATIVLVVSLAAAQAAEAKPTRAIDHGGWWEAVWSWVLEAVSPSPNKDDGRGTVVGDG